jgi:hypothetical protein
MFTCFLMASFMKSVNTPFGRALRSSGSRPHALVLKSGKSSRAVDASGWQRGSGCTQGWLVLVRAMRCARACVWGGIGGHGGWGGVCVCARVWVGVHLDARREARVDASVQLEGLLHWVQVQVLLQVVDSGGGRAAAGRLRGARLAVAGGGEW